jgi:hypothetical protein
LQGKERIKLIKEGILEDKLAKIINIQIYNTLNTISGLRKNSLVNKIPNVLIFLMFI